MSRLVKRLATVCVVFTGLTAHSAFAQFFPGTGAAGVNPCPPPVAYNPCVAPVAAAPVSTFAQTASAATDCRETPTRLTPVAKTCYREVAVTEYQNVKRTVQRPVVETRYVDQPVTQYRPVTEQRVVNVPTVSYTPVTECRTVTRDMGRWVTHRQPIYRPCSCDYNNQPGFMGWLSRTGYEMRSAFAPKYRTHRQYYPQMITQQIPFTRQVATRSTRQVAYNVTRYQPYQTTRKVAVNSVRYVAEEVNERRPVTVMKRVPVGTQLAWVTSNGTTVATQMLPSTESVRTALGSSHGDTRTATTPVPRRTADSRADEFKSGEKFERDANKQPFKKDGETFKGSDATAPKTKEQLSFNSSAPQLHAARRAGSAPVPTAVRAARWTQRTPRGISVASGR